MPWACVQLRGCNPIFNFDYGMGCLKFFTEFERRSRGNSESLKMLEWKRQCKPTHNKYPFVSFKKLELCLNQQIKAGIWRNSNFNWVGYYNYKTLADLGLCTDRYMRFCTQTSPVTITCLRKSWALIGPEDSQSAVSRVFPGRAIQMLWLSNQEGVFGSETLVTAKRLQPQQTGAQRQPGAAGETWDRRGAMRRGQSAAQGQ